MSERHRCLFDLRPAALRVRAAQPADGAAPTGEKRSQVRLLQLDVQRNEKEPAADCTDRPNVSLLPFPALSMLLVGDTVTFRPAQQSAAFPIDGNLGCASPRQAAAMRAPNDANTVSGNLCRGTAPQRGQVIEMAPSAGEQSAPCA